MIFVGNTLFVTCGYLLIYWVCHPMVFSRIQNTDYMQPHRALTILGTVTSAENVASIVEDFERWNNNHKTGEWPKIWYALVENEMNIQCGSVVSSM